MQAYIACLALLGAQVAVQVFCASVSVFPFRFSVIQVTVSASRHITCDSHSEQREALLVCVATSQHNLLPLNRSLLCLVMVPSDQSLSTATYFEEESPWNRGLNGIMDSTFVLQPLASPSNGGATIPGSVMSSSDGEDLMGKWNLCKVCVLYYA